MHGLRLKDIHLRDPFILSAGIGYVLYGTRGPTAWTEASGFDCYTSQDLVHWHGPIEIFHKPEGFWADRCYWAPECHARSGVYYLLATFASADGRMGVQVLVGEEPTGPFLLHSDGPVTPSHWQSLDGTLYVDQTGTPYLVFSRSFVEAPSGEMCAVELSPDLKSVRGEPRVLFRATEAPWTRPFPCTRSEFGLDVDAYLSDGPFLYRTESGQLLLLWSSFATHGYAIGVARSTTGDLHGPWIHDPAPLIDQDGGHGMVFGSRDGGLWLVMHWPNTKGEERPRLVELVEQEDNLRVRTPTLRLSA